MTMNPSSAAQRYISKTTYRRIEKQCSVMMAALSDVHQVPVLNVQRNEIVAVLCSFVVLFFILLLPPYVPALSL